MEDPLVRLSVSFVRACWVSIAVVAIGVATFAIIKGVLS